MEQQETEKPKANKEKKALNQTTREKAESVQLPAPATNQTLLPVVQST